MILQKKKSQPFVIPVAPLVQCFDSADVVPSGVSSGSCLCWRRRCTATAPPSGARTTWQESQEARFQYTQVAHTPRAPLSSSQIWSRVASHCVVCSLVISALPVARPLYYSTSPLSVDASTCGSISPARKAASQLEPNPGMKDTPVMTH